MTTLSLASLLAEPARRTPDDLAVVQGERRLTYAQMWETARRVGAQLLEQGVAPGDRVALIAANTVEFIAGYYGVLAMGGTVVPVPTLLQPREAAYLLGHSGAGVVLYDPLVEALGTGAAEHAGLPAYSLGGFGAQTEPLAVMATREAEDTAVLFYTSGTTGTPKGAKLTHLNLVLNALISAADSGDLAAGDRVLGALPLFHVFGQSVVLNACFRAGCTLVLQPRFEPVSALKIMVEEDVQVFLGVPTMFVFLLQAAKAALEAGVPREQALPNLRYCASGGAALPVPVLEAFDEVFQTSIYEGYGLSETSPSAVTNQPSVGRKKGSIGTPIWGVDAEIADPAVLDRIEFLPPGERGEIVVRGHNVFAGYLNDPDATEAALIDGWFRTGDIGVKDEDGYFSVVDRTKDLIIRGGFNVYPREVEDALARRPEITQVAVIGVPDDERGEEVVAVVVVAPGSELDAEELIAWSREELGHHKYPRRIEIVEELPMGPSQKVLKRALRQRFA